MPVIGFVKRGPNVGFFLSAIIHSGTNTRTAQFGLSSNKLISDDRPRSVVSKKISINSDKVLLRLGEAKFRPGATAFRHIHPGAGPRYLSEGKLEVISDGHRETAKVGRAWFEPANSPVQAVASMNYPMTSFIRFLVLPIEYAGKPTIHILDADDAMKPSLRVTRRHFDQVVQLAPG